MQGYYRFPAIYKNKIAFISDDDLWLSDLNTLNSKRLTTNIANVSSPKFSPDGNFISYIGIEDGNTEVYIIPSEGGISTRLTFEGAFISKVALWNKDGIIYASDLEKPFNRISDLRIFNISNNCSKALNFGISSNIAIHNDFTVIGRNTQDPARWKRYKGGTAGELWIDHNKNNFNKLINIKGNLACPLIINQRIYFISDHEGIANIYSCLKTGKSLLKHTNHKNYFVRNASSDNSKIIYHCGARLFILDIKSNKVNKLNIKYNNSNIDTGRKFSCSTKYLEHASLSNNGQLLNIISRGKSFVIGNWDGPALQYGKFNGVRYKHPIQVNKNKNLLICSDENNIEHFELYNLKSSNLIKSFKRDLGRIINVKKSPTTDVVAFLNHKHELHLFDLSKKSIIKIDHSTNHPIDFNWSPDGKYIAYSCSLNSRISIIKIYSLNNKKSFEVSDAINQDSSPVFDNSGKYLAFLSKRTFNPVYDSIQFDLNFTQSEKPYIIILDKKTDSPFIKNAIKKDKPKEKKKKKDLKVKVNITFDNIKNRIIQVPIKETTLDNSIGFIDNKIFYMKWPIQGSREDGWYSMDDQPKGTIYYYDLNKLEEKLFYSGASSFTIDNKSNNILINSDNVLSVLSTKAPPSKDIIGKNNFNKETGKINLSRINLSINVKSEWQQMYSEAWRLQRDYFWTEDMSGINWNKIFKRYYSLIDRISTRSEFSDLIWEMQGELGTSHCYEFGGDYKPIRKYNTGLLSTNLKYNKKFKAYEINDIAKGDLWDSYPSPLLRPGLNIKSGDLIYKINNIKLSKDKYPGEFLVNQTGNQIQITVADNKGKNKRNVVITPNSYDKHLYYRDWVENNRNYVHQKSKGKIGYVHIPDMGADGFAEFHRYFLAEIIYDGLIIDVRYNGGGHVSQLLLSKLAKKRIGYDLTRWMGVEPYPSESPAGPMVAITNEYAGSDGDIFSHSWKLLKLGKLIGKRTWGGVIGIWPRNTLVDGTLTTQPEFSFWFKDVGWNVENYGTDVDIEINDTPQDYRKGIDRQLDKSISVVLNDLKKPNAILRANLKDKPSLKLP
tara:strand:- start:529 stop:3708 length:3180 start_codon:yes stop_codon:yes gene_type:complete